MSRLPPTQPPQVTPQDSMDARFITALVLLAAVVAGWFYGGPALRFAPLGISIAWAIVEIVIERRRRHSVPKDAQSHDS